MKPDWIKEIEKKHALNYVESNPIQRGHVAALLSALNKACEALEQYKNPSNWAELGPDDEKVHWIGPAVAECDCVFGECTCPWAGGYLAQKALTAINQEGK